MAESPAYWHRRERIIQKTIEEQTQAAQEGVCGWSIARAIANALEVDGQMTIIERKEHNHFTRVIDVENCDQCAAEYAQTVLDRSRTQTTD